MIDYNSNDFILQLVKEYKNSSVNALAKKYKCSRHFITKKLVTGNYSKKSHSELTKWKISRKYRDLKMSNHPKWKGGINTFGNRNYIRLNSKLYRLAHYNWCIDNDFSHIPKNMVIHHIDLNTLNDNPNNLVMLDVRTHLQLHCRLQNNLIGKNKQR